MKVDLSLWILPMMAAGVLRVLYASLRIRHAHVERIERLNKGATSYIMAFWHEQLLLMVYARFRRPITALISQHRDGELMARTMSYFDAGATRGSSTRAGSAALRDLIRAASQEVTIAITPDGPRGPRRVAQAGAIAAAQAAQIPIIPVAFVAKKKRL